MRKLQFKDLEFTRNSPAWCPVTGNSVSNNVPRIVENYILETNNTIDLYYSFPSTQGFTAYSTDPGAYERSGETTDYYTDLADDLETNVPSLTRFVLGTSEEGRDIDAFRLGPASRKHFMCTCVCHGNEVDGLAGSFKGFEILCTHPDFQELRDNFTLFFVGCWNPDGHYNHTRFLSKLGPNPDGTDKPINLNREWPNSWAEFSPSSSESKGATYLSSKESQAMYDYITTGNSGGRVQIAFLMDQHSTIGDGVRYQSRDRQYKDISEGDWVKIWGDWVVYRNMRARQAKRVHEEDAPDLMVNYYRSRFSPYWHAWVSNVSKDDNGGIAPLAMVTEHNKVDFVLTSTDREDYQSACNYNLDYLISAGQLMQGSLVEYKDALLVEHEVGNNQLNNSEMDVWYKRNDSGDEIEYRPSFFSYTKSDVESIGRNSKHMDYHGRAIKLSPNTSLELPVGESADGYHDIQEMLFDSNNSIVLSSVNSGGGSVYVLDQNKSTSKLELLFTDSLLPNNREKRLIGGNESKVVLMDMGDGLNNLKVIEYNSSNGYSRNVLTTYSASRQNGAVAFDGDSGYIVGGYDGGALSTVLEVSRSTGIISELGTDILNTANYNMEAIYCLSGALDGYVAAIGGSVVNDGYLNIELISVASNQAYKYEVDVSGLELENGIIGHALSYNYYDNEIRIYGGKNPSTDIVYSSTWSLKWNDSLKSWSISELELFTGSSFDNDPEDYSGDSIWGNLKTNWRASTRTDVNEGSEIVFLFGGLDGYEDTRLPNYDGDCRGFYIHDVVDEMINEPQTSNYCYVRSNNVFETDSNGRFSLTWSAKADEGTSVGYVRANNAAGASDDSLMSSRRARSYYMHPPKWWWRDHSTVDFGAGRPDRDEDELRIYIRGYKDSQDIFVDSLMLQENTLWPSSWSPGGLTRQSETAIWSNALDPRYFRVQFTWMPSAVFLCAEDNITLLKINDGNRRIELVALSGDRNERAYSRNYLYAQVDPKLQLRVYDDLDGYVSCETPVYWGGYTKETANQKFDAPLTFDIWRHPDYGTGIVINNAGAISKNIISGSFSKSNWQNTADVEILGGGWWGEPSLYPINIGWINKNKDSFINGSLLVGDRDPTRGKVNAESTFRYTEEFDRIDDDNLGEDWDIIKQTDPGFNIYDGYARCALTGWEKWDAEPNIRDCSILSTVIVEDNNSRVGLFSRLNHYISREGLAHGYLGTLYVDGSGNKFLQIEKLTGYGVQNRNTLNSVSCSYVIGSPATLEFSCEEDSLELTLKDGDIVLGTCMATDSEISKPGSFGICGETASSSSYVFIDDVQAFPGGNVKIKITE